MITAPCYKIDVMLFLWKQAFLHSTGLLVQLMHTHPYRPSLFITCLRSSNIRYSL